MAKNSKLMNISAEHSSFRVALVGMYPPPIGGVSIHLKRLKHVLDHYGIDSIVFDISGEQHDAKAPNVISVRNFKVWLIEQLFYSQEDIIHYHGSNWNHRCALILFKLRSKKVIFTFHSLRENIEAFHPFKRWIIKQLVFRFADHFIAPGPEVKASLTTAGVSAQKVTVIPTFIPPEIDQKDYDATPDYIWNFMEHHQPIVSANAYRLSFHQMQDLYGLDMCIDLVDGLKSTYPNVGLIFCLPDIGEEEYFREIQLKVRKLQLDKTILFVHEKIELYPILERSDLFVRPTNTDSYGVSVAESIHLNTPVLASNVCQRPKGTVLFTARDTDMFIESSKEILHNLNNYKKRVQLVAIEDFSNQIRDIYEMLLSTQ